MTEKIKIGIVGYGNVGQGVEKNMANFQDMELVAVFTRRETSSIGSKAKVYPMDEILNFKEQIDVMVLCGGSHSDLPKQAPNIAVHFNTVDSYDNHSNINNYLDSINKVNLASETTSIVSIGWDPGIFSLNRLLFESILPSGTNYTFWGKGVSQGHSEIVRNVKGVKYGIQYTVPKEESIECIRAGESPDLEASCRHKRICYLVSEDQSLNKDIEDEIKNIPAYFKDYETHVNFISEEEFLKDHTSMPHGGTVIRTGTTQGENKHCLEFNLRLDNNPEFTSSILLSYARACHRLSKEGKYGAFSIFDLPIKYIAPADDFTLRKTLL